MSAGRPLGHPGTVTRRPLLATAACREPQGVGLEALADTSEDSFVRTIPTTAELFAAGYELWSDPLYAYVSKRVAGRQVRERIVREVLSQNLDLLVGRREEMSEASRLMTSADRLIAYAVTDADLFLDRRRQERWSRQRPR
jgi:hypothetical protein